MELKLSIVVPIYKVEQYLPKCVDSLLVQDLPKEEYEIILVDDGSPDRCGEICDEYAVRFDNVKVIHRENGGLSAARNTGIGIAQGEYVQFVDSDDYLEPNVLKELVEKMERECLDILRFNYLNVNEEYEIIEPNKDPRRYVDYLDKVCDGSTFLNERLGPACYVWQFMLRRDLIEKCRFLEGIYFEDVEWTPRVLLRAKRLNSTNLVVYYYQIRMGSITQSVDERKKRKVLEDKMKLIDAMKVQMMSVADKRWFEGMIAQTVLSIINYVCENYYDERHDVINGLKDKEVFPMSTFLSNETAKRKIRIANVSPLLLCFLIRFNKTNRIVK